MSFSVKQSKKTCAALIAVLVGFSAFAIADSIEERLKPVGDVCMVGEPCAAVAAPTVAGEARSGEQIYSTKCFTCHETGAAGAPKLTDDSWPTREAERTLAGLYNSAINGFKGMPAMGLCLDCTDEEIQAAVDYMLTGN